MEPAVRAELLVPLTEWLAQAEAGLLDRLPVVQRARWHLLRQERFEELARIVALDDRRAVQGRARHRAGRWYADVPELRAALGSAPPELVALDEELAVAATVRAVEVDRGSLRITGTAWLPPLGARRPWGRRVEVVLDGPDAPPLPLRARRRRVGDADGDEPDRRWAGFTATTPLEPLVEALAAGPGERVVRVVVRGRAVRRETTALSVDEPHPVPAAVVPAGGRQLRAELIADGQLVVRLEGRSAVLRDVGVDGGRLVVRGTVRAGADATVAVELSATGQPTLSVEARPDDGAADARSDGAGRAFRADVDLAALVGPADERYLPIGTRRAAGTSWTVGLRVGAGRRTVAVDDVALGRRWADGDDEVVVGRSWRGLAVVTRRRVRPELTAVSADGVLELDVPPGVVELFLEGVDGIEARVPARTDGRRAVVPLRPLLVDLPPGRWLLLSRLAADGSDTRATTTTADRLYAELPRRWRQGGRLFTLGVDRQGVPLLVAGEPAP
jgi:hypothetical protein